MARVTQIDSANQNANLVADAWAADLTVFSPKNKFSPLKMLPTDGYANGSDDTGTPAVHDASGNAVPSFTTAKKRQICVVTTAGTLGGVSVGVNDFLMALRDNPTLSSHWSIIKDSTTEFNAAVESADGSPVALYGTYLLKTANPDAAPNLVGEYTILYLCGYPAIYQTANNTHAALQTPRQCSSAGRGLAQGLDVDDEVGTTLQEVSYFTLTTAADVQYFPLNKMVEVFTDAVHVSTANDSSKGYISNAFRVTSTDAATGTVYADRVIRYHNRIANATNIYVIPLHEDRAINIRPGGTFMGAPTVIGGQVGWWLTLDGYTQLTGVISGSGSTRTITMANMPLWIANQGVRFGTVSGTMLESCKVVSRTSTTLVITVTGTDDKGHAYSEPTSGTVYFQPCWWTSEFDNTTHGGAIVAQQAHGSKIDAEFSRVWAMSVRLRFSHFCSVKERLSKVVNIGTGISGKSWRLTYGVEAYSSSRNEVEVGAGSPGQGGRHPYTTSSGSTSVAWSANHWQSRSGCSCENRVKLRTSGDTGPGGDTHAMTNGDEIESVVDFPTTYNTAHSYRGIGNQRRCENGKTIHRQRGGQVGMRIANGSSYTRGPGSIDEIDLDVSDIPMRSDSHAFAPSGSSGNLPCGFIMQSQSAYTGGNAGERTQAIGKFRFKNAACGFVFESYTRGEFTKIEHLNVGYAGGWLQDQSKVHARDVDLDYSLAGGIATTSVTSVAIGTGSKSHTVDTGLGIVEGQNVLLQDSSSVTNSRTNYMIGRVVSYNSGTGALVSYVEVSKGSGTKTAWTITAGASIPRYGIVMSGASEFTFSVMKWKVGEGANPDEIFHSRDNTAGKVVTGGILIIDDPLLKGQPRTFTNGRDADFTIKIGLIIYNGVAQVTEGVGLNVEAPTNKTYCIKYSMPYAGTISATKTKCTSGTATATFKINTTALGGTANAVSSSGDSVTQSSANAFVAGDTLNVTISVNASCVDLLTEVIFTKGLS